MSSSVGSEDISAKTHRLRDRLTEGLQLERRLLSKCPTDSGERQLTSLACPVDQVLVTMTGWTSTSFVVKHLWLIETFLKVRLNRRARRTNSLSRGGREVGVPLSDSLDVVCYHHSTQLTKLCQLWSWDSECVDLDKIESRQDHWAQD
jgi:hypothetical protein